jgi:hypothetical protein
VAFILESSLFSGKGEWLARATAGPYRSIVRPSGQTEGIAPAPDTGEKVALGEGFKVIRGYLRYGSVIHLAVSNKPPEYQGFEPAYGERVVFVIICVWFRHERVVPYVSGGVKPQPPFLIGAIAYMLHRMAYSRSGSYPLIRCI